MEDRDAITSSDAGPSTATATRVGPQVADTIAAAVLGIYHSLGKGKGKPVIRSDGKLEHTVLSAIVLYDASDSNPPLVVSLATGVKVTPYVHLSKYGDVLHDSHAEVLARRGFRLWVMRQLLRQVKAQRQQEEDPGKVKARETSSLSLFERLAGEPKWRLDPRFRVYWYTSTPPCGNASSSLSDSDHITRSQSERLIESVPIGIPLRGRLESSLSYLRTKPGRPDSPPAISHSCSDKIALSTRVGLLGSLLSHLVEPIWADALVVGAETLGGGGQESSPAQLERSRGRIEEALNAPGKRAPDASSPPYRHHHLPVLVSCHSFADSKPSVEAKLESQGRQAADTIAASGSLTWILDVLHEGIYDGRRQGSSGKRKPGQPLGPSQRSGLSKLSLLQTYIELCQALTTDRPRVEVEAASTTTNYWHAKRRPPSSLTLTQTQAVPALLGSSESQNQRSISEYRMAKAILRGVPEPPDEVPASRDGRGENVARFLARAMLPAEERMRERMREAQVILSRIQGSGSGTSEGSVEGSNIPTRTRAPFDGWLIAGRDFESFDAHGRIGGDGM